AGLGVHVVAVQANECPLARCDANGVERGRTETEFIELAHGIGLQVDADTERFHVCDGFEHAARHAYLVQRQCRGKAADTGPGNQDRCGHFLSSFWSSSFWSSSFW